MLAYSVRRLLDLPMNRDELPPAMVAIRPAVPGDDALVLDYVRRLAKFEGCAASVRATEADLRRDLFETRIIHAAFAYLVPEKTSSEGTASPSLARTTPAATAATAATAHLAHSAGTIAEADSPPRDSSSAGHPRTTGFALWYYSYSTFRGKPGLYLEDIYVDRDSRGCGIGRTLLEFLRETARTAGCDRIEWSVLGWNEDAKAFYRAMGGVPNAGWESYRLEL